MTTEQMIEEIREFEKELWMEYNECVEAFGHIDQATQRSLARWCVIEELIEKLKNK